MSSTTPATLNHLQSCQIPPSPRDWEKILQAVKAAFYLNMKEFFLIA